MLEVAQHPPCVAVGKFDAGCRAADAALIADRGEQFQQQGQRDRGTFALFQTPFRVDFKVHICNI
jgi:hypothetical protein